MSRYKIMLSFLWKQEKCRGPEIYLMPIAATLSREHQQTPTLCAWGAHRHGKTPHPSGAISDTWKSLLGRGNRGPTLLTGAELSGAAPANSPSGAVPIKGRLLIYFFCWCKCAQWGFCQCSNGTRGRAEGNLHPWLTSTDWQTIKYKKVLPSNLFS